MMKVEGAREMTKTLIEMKADVNKPGPMKFTPLHQCGMHGDKEIIKMLLDANANPNAKEEIGEMTPLMSLISGSQMQMVQDQRIGGCELLIAAKESDLNQKDTFGKTAFHKAVEQNFH